MRNLLFILIIIQTLVGCEEKITDAFAYSGVLEVSETEMRFEPSAFSKTIQVKGVIEWDVDTNSIEPWCQITTVKNHDSKEYLTVAVTPNKETNNRETEFNVISGTQQVVVNIVQLGNIPQVLFSSDSLVIGLDTNLLKIGLVTNIEYEISLNADWFKLEEESSEGGKRMLISVSVNNSGVERKGVITFKNKTGLEEWRWTFRQLSTKAPYSLSEEDKLDPNLKILPISATASSYVEGKNTDNSYDGNKVTHYQSNFQEESEPVVLEYRFDGESPIGYINYIPYEGDTEKTFKTTEIWVEQEDGEYELVKTQVFQKSGEQVVVFENIIEKPSGIKFVVKSSYDKEPNLLVAACAEMEFYSAKMRYPDIFADPVYGSLQEDVTLDKIFEIENPVFRNIAYCLFHNSYDEGRIMKCYAYPDVKPNYLSFYGSYGGLDNVTGISVKAGDVIPIFADQIKENLVYVVVFNPEDPYEMKKYRLFDGVNKITMDFDGHLYVSFVSTGTKEINIHIAGGNYNGYYDSSKETAYDLSNIENSSYLDVVGNHAHLIFKKEHLLGSDLLSLLNSYDKIVTSQQLFMGLNKYEQEFANRILFMGVSGKFDVKYQSHYVECPEVDMEKFTQVEQITGKTLWDLATAVGTIHNHKYLRWKGITYTTPKLFALATQQAFGEALEVDSKKWYSEAFASIIVPEEKLASLRDDISDYPEKIVPFWQLQLYAKEVLGEDDFYMDVLYNLRKKTGGVRDSDFMKFVQNRLKLDLRSFFGKWGFSTTVSNSYEKAPETLIYLTPNNIEQFKNGNMMPSADGYKLSGAKVSIINPQNVVAYLVRHTFVPMQVFDVESFNVKDWKASMRIYALGVDGTEVELFRN